MNNNSPTQTPNRPPQGQQQRPVQGQQRPAQGQRPIQGQQRPAQGQRPIQGQQRPMQGQRPIQGQQRPMQGQQRPMQGQPRPQQARPRPQGAPRQAGNDDLSMRSILTIAIIAVAIILVVSIVVGVIVMAYNGVFEDIADIFDKDKGGYVSDDEDDDGPSKPSSGGLSFPNTLGLPVIAPKNNYVSSKASGVKTISGIQSEAAILVKMNGNVSIAEKNADTRVHPASMSKLMTLIVACEKITDTNALLTVEQWMLNYKSDEEGSGTSFLEAGEQICVEDALYLISYKSDTVCCLMIAEYVAGSEKEFVKLMNEKAAALGLKDTHFANTTGLYEDVTKGNNPDYTYTTCRDMAAIMNCAMNNKAVKSIITSTSKSFNVYKNGTRYTEGDFSESTRWYSHGDRFAGNRQITTDLKVIAGKTGGEDIPSSCFVTVAEDSSGEMYICVVIGRINQSGAYVDEKKSTADTKHIYKNYIN